MPVPLDENRPAQVLGVHSTLGRPIRSVSDHARRQIAVVHERGILVFDLLAYPQGRAFPVAEILDVRAASLRDGVIGVLSGQGKAAVARFFDLRGPELQKLGSDERIGELMGIADPVFVHPLEDATGFVIFDRSARGKLRVLGFDRSRGAPEQRFETTLDRPITRVHAIASNGEHVFVAAVHERMMGGSGNPSMPVSSGRLSLQLVVLWATADRPEDWRETVRTSLTNGSKIVDIFPGRELTIIERLSLDRETTEFMGVASAPAARLGAVEWSQRLPTGTQVIPGAEKKLAILEPGGSPWFTDWGE